MNAGHYWKAAAVPVPPGGEKRRAIILTDIGADPDDTQSLVRLLLYSNLIDIEGLIATTSCWLKTRVNPEAVKDVIGAYGRVRTNLLRHEPGFPAAASLLAKTKPGRAEYGMHGVGEGKDSPGSEWIVKTLNRADPRSLWICVWGGTNVLAQALFKIRKTESAVRAGALIAKLRVYAISDQDDSGAWIRRNFPELFYIVSPGDDYGGATWSAINTRIDGARNDAIGNEWLARHVQQGHGPLGAVYPDTAYGMEGDTPSWLSLIPNGLNEPERPDWGGWGGRYELRTPDVSARRTGTSGVPSEPETRPIWTDAVDSYLPYLPGEYGRTVRPGPAAFTDNKATLWRWRDDFQNDFAARMDWCTRPYREANHPPVPGLLTPARLTAASGRDFFLDARAADPDGDSVSFLWFHYPEAGSWRRPIKIESAENAAAVRVKAPVVEKAETAHFILSVTDKGRPPLTRYQRVIVTITPD